jgi:hypothetical protein
MISRLLLAAMILAAVAPAARAGFVQEVRPLVEQHCAKCHKEGRERGGVNLAKAQSEGDVLRQYKVWRRVLEQVETGEMPPDDDTGFGPAHQKALLGGVKKILSLLEQDHPQLRDPGPDVIRRLSRSEYQRVIRDLFGLEVDIVKQVGLPEDSTGSHFDNVAAALTLPPAMIEKYFAAVDTVVDLLAPPVDAPEPSDWAAKDRAGKARKAAEKLFAGMAKDRAGAEQFISRTLRLAWRRPVAAPEVTRLMALVDAGMASGETLERSTLRALKPALVSPNFLYRIEESRTASGGGKAARVSDLELATRLSFFIWGSVPDDELLALAEKSQLSAPSTLMAQTKRMLSDARAETLTQSFFIPWLQLHKLEQARPSTEFFPTFNHDMKRGMRREVELFCDAIRTEDRSVLDLLRADYTFVNEALARHYGIDGVSGKEFKRVSLDASSPRGGVLGMAGVLALTSHTHRTSPTLRGAYVLDVIFGTPPSPPPANVSQIDEGRKRRDGNDPQTFREKLALHAEDATCAGCHRRIDPLGFGLENFDAIGAWRQSGPELDASGELPGGRKFNGAIELREVLWERRDQFLRNLVGETLAYALGRKLDYFDEPQIARIVAALHADGFKFSTLISGVISSYPFQHRRASDAQSPTKTASR